MNSCLLTQAEAAAYLGVSVSTFKRHVKKHLPFTPIGTLKKYEKEDLDEWRATQKVGKSFGVGASRMSASGTTGSGSSSVAVREIRARLERRQRASTPKLLLVKG